MLLTNTASRVFLVEEKGLQPGLCTSSACTVMRLDLSSQYSSLLYFSLLHTASAYLKRGSEWGVWDSKVVPGLSGTLGLLKHRPGGFSVLMPSDLKLYWALHCMPGTVLSSATEWKQRISWHVRNFLEILSLNQIVFKEMRYFSWNAHEFFAE